MAVSNSRPNLKLGSKKQHINADIEEYTILTDKKEAKENGLAVVGSSNSLKSLKGTNQRRKVNKNALEQSSDKS